MLTFAKTALAAVAVLAASSSFATAYGPGSAIDKQRTNQAKSIERGRITGAITWREGLKLRQEQARIARLEAIYKADGKFDYQERRHIVQLRKAAAQNIRSEKTDAWSRPTILPRIGR
jgi:hypothetical protein